MPCIGGAGQGMLKHPLEETVSSNFDVGEFEPDVLEYKLESLKYYKFKILQAGESKILQSCWPVPP